LAAVREELEGWDGSGCPVKGFTPVVEDGPWKLVVSWEEEVQLLGDT
jgi:hypothetical protein